MPEKPTVDIVVLGPLIAACSNICNPYYYYYHLFNFLFKIKVFFKVCATHKRQSECKKEDKKKVYFKKFILIRKSMLSTCAAEFCL